MKFNKFTIIGFTIFACNCSIQKANDKNASYNMTVLKMSAATSIVYGSVKEYGSGLNTISLKMKIDNQEWKEIDIKSGKHDIRVGALGYKSVQLPKIKFKYGDSIK